MSLDGVILGTASVSQPIAFEARFATSPSSVTTQADVIIPSASENHRYGPCPWPQRGTTLPVRGDRCLVTFSDDGSPWIIGWWPS